MSYQPAPFRASRWLRHAHFQTIFGRLLRREGWPELRRERWETPDGDFVDLDFAPEPATEHAPLVLLLHGLEGSARRGYAINTYRALAARGVGAVGLNFRSCSGEVNRTARFYHSGDTEDIRFVLRGLAERFPGRRLGAVGFSLGGNALLKYLGEDGEAARVSAAAAVSVPFDLGAGARLLDSTRMGRFYTSLFLKTLREKAEAKQPLLDGRLDLARIRDARTFREFDDAATAPLHGFADADDYYARSSSGRFLERIRVPTLLLHSRDDPFLPEDAIPWAAIRANPRLHAVVTDEGGHVGFVGGNPFRPEFWAEEEAARFLASELA
ncbi:MAG TPA: hydrolase [Longimicrobiales bacterium]|nr:hydrolase [Longimicrobiales bacterium]